MASREMPLKKNIGSTAELTIHNRQKSATVCPFPWRAKDPALMPGNFFNSTSYRKEVRPGYVNGSKIEILSGLDAGDSVVTIGQSSLNDSSLVEVVTY